MFRDSVLPGEDCPHAVVFPFPDERQAGYRPCRAWLPAFLALHEGHPHHRPPSLPSFRATDRQAACAVLRCPARHRPRQQASLRCGGQLSCQHPDVPWGAPVCPSSCRLPFLQSAAARGTVRRTCCLYIAATAAAEAVRRIHIGTVVAFCRTGRAGTAPRRSISFRMSSRSPLGASSPHSLCRRVRSLSSHSSFILHVLVCSGPSASLQADSSLCRTAMQMCRV